MHNFQRQGLAIIMQPILLYSQAGRCCPKWRTLQSTAVKYTPRSMFKAFLAEIAAYTLFSVFNVLFYQGYRPIVNINIL